MGLQKMIRRRKHAAQALLASLVLHVAGCGDGSTTDGVPSLDGPSPEPPPAECAVRYDGTFAAIQDVIFERHGCTADACHGEARSGDLDLRSDAAYRELVEVASSGVALPRVNPGDNDRSYLWRKVAAKTRPGSVEIGGSPMPSGATTLTEEELVLLREWIKSGAPERGTVLGTSELIDGCLPDPEPITIEPLAPPPPGEGLQIVMPAYDLPAATEREVCIAQYYDVSDQVPPEYLNENGTSFRVSISELRQDPQSHHLVLYQNGTAVPSVFGDFTCRGGERAGQSCEATDLAFCGSGVCAGPTASAIETPLSPGSVTCVDYGPPGTFNFPIFIAQQSQERQELSGGVYAEIPVRGLWIWNSHAFNLTTAGHSMNARINYWFATEPMHQVVRLSSIDKIYTNNTPPYGTETLCTEYTFPQGTRLFNLLSHTHKRGKRFWIEGPDGNLIYENFVYNDPVNQYYDPPLAFDSPEPAARTIRYCAYYENGVRPDGSPDPSTVKRRSTTTPNSLQICEPVACTAGRIGELCRGVDDGAACDSSPGAGDGECDACVLRGGNSTEDEMFLVLGAYYVQ